MQSDLASPLNVHHPVICEGSGKRIIGPNAQIGKEAEVSVGKEGILTIGANLRLGKGAVLRLGNNQSTFDWARFQDGIRVPHVRFELTGASAMKFKSQRIVPFSPEKEELRARSKSEMARTSVITASSIVQPMSSSAKKSQSVQIASCIRTTTITPLIHLQRGKEVDLQRHRHRGRRMGRIWRDILARRNHWKTSRDRGRCSSDQRHSRSHHLGRHPRQTNRRNRESLTQSSSRER